MWNNLTDNQKIQYKKYCDNKYGKTIMFCETGEPMYFDNNMCLVDTKIVLDLLFTNNLN